MRPPFSIAKFSPKARAAIKPYCLAAVGAGSVLSILLAATLIAKTDHAPQIATPAATSEAVVLDRKNVPLCVARDTRLVSAIEAAVADAYDAMAKARDLCNAGRVKEALSIYDRIKIAPVR